MAEGGMMVEEGIENIQDIKDPSCFGLAIVSLVTAPIIYFIAHYVSYEYVGATIIEYMSYFIALSGMFFAIFGIIGKILERKIIKDN